VMGMTPIPEIEIISVATIDQLCDCLPKRRKYFTLLLAVDAVDVDEERLMTLFRPLVCRGLAYFCVWGKGCSAVHDAVDLCVVLNEIDHGEAGYLLMTTWYEDVPLVDSLWTFKMIAIPAECDVFGSFDRFAVAVGNAEWAESMRLSLQ